MVSLIVYLTEIAYQFVFAGYFILLVLANGTVVHIQRE